MYSYRNGKKVILESDESRVVVRSRPDQVQEYGLIVEEELSSASVLIQNSTISDEEAIKKASDLYPVYPYLLEQDSKTPFLVTDRILITLQDDFDRQALSNIAAEHALLVLAELSPDTFLLGLTAQSEKDPIEIVVDLNENKPKGIVSVEHDLNLPVVRMGSTEKMGPVPAISDPRYNEQWHLHARSNSSQFDPRSSSFCEDAWHDLGSYGNSNVVIAVTDDGCRLDHPDFNNGKFSGWGYFRGTRLITDADVDGLPSEMYVSGSNHGTACCGVVAAEVDSKLTVGAAPGCSLLPIKWESNGPYLSISDSKLLIAINYLADKVDVISNSWGVLPNSIWSLNVVNRIKYLTENGGRRGKGILFLWAAGNSNCPINYSGNEDIPYTNGWQYRFGQWRWEGVKTSRVFQNNLVGIPGVMHVAALSSVASKSHYSCYGEGISICAPSSNSHAYFRLSVEGIPITTASGDGGLVDEKFGGTSSATPLVAGVAGLLLSADEELSAVEVQQILEDTADVDLNFSAYARTPPSSYDADTSWDISPIAPFDSGQFNSDGWSPWFGYGKVNAFKAISSILSDDQEWSDHIDDAEEFQDEDLEMEIESVVSSIDEGLEDYSVSFSSNDVLFPSNGNSVTYTLTLKYSDGRPAPGQSVTAESRPISLTGSAWRTINGLASQWPARSARILRERHRQGLVRLGATFDKTSATTDRNGKVSFTVRAWHVCGDEAQPSTDEVTFRSAAGVDRNRVRCGVSGLSRVPNNRASGIETKRGMRGKYAHPQVNRILSAVGQAWKGVSGKPAGMPDFITITDASYRWGGLIKPHLTHRFGGSVDIRPISTDGNPTSVGSSNYSREGTAIIIDFLRQTGATRIIFGEQLPGVTDVKSDHKSHIHVSWLQDPREPWLFPPQIPSVTSDSLLESAKTNRVSIRKRRKKGNSK